MTTQSQAAKPPVTRFDAVIVGAGMVGAGRATGRSGNAGGAGGSQGIAAAPG